MDIPVVPKLTPNTPNISEIALAAVEGGADAICAINTLGPGYTSAHGHPVLSNGAGGMSGKAVLPIALNVFGKFALFAIYPLLAVVVLVVRLMSVRPWMLELMLSVIGSALTGLTTAEMVIISIS